MESFRMYESSQTNVLENLKNVEYRIESSDIQKTIDDLYALVNVNKDYIDDVIFAIEKLCDNNEEFKKEWFGAIDEVESEVLEESKLSKLASIAVLAIAMGVSFTGCSPSVDLEQKAQEYEVSHSSQEENPPEEGGIENMSADELVEFLRAMGEEKPKVETEKVDKEDVIFYISNKIPLSDPIYISPPNYFFNEVKNVDWNDTCGHWDYSDIWVDEPTAVHDAFIEGCHIYVSKDGGKTKEPIEYCHWFRDSLGYPAPNRR